MSATLSGPVLGVIAYLVVRYNLNIISIQLVCKKNEEKKKRHT